MRQSKAQSPLEAILLDVDGTLYHASPVRLGMVVKLALGHAWSPRIGLRTVSMLAAYRRAQERLRAGEHDGASSLAAAQVELSSQVVGATAGAMEAVVKRWMHEEPRSLLPWARRRGLLEFLELARARKVKLGVVSDYPADDKLDVLGVRHFFDVVVSAQDAEVQRFKPDPRGILHALERLGVGPDRAAYVGDRAEVDLRAAERAGVRGVLLRGTTDYHALRRRLFHGHG